ncbi:MAG: acyltransferase family protein [Actinomycetota bacterium]
MRTEVAPGSAGVVDVQEPPPPPPQAADREVDVEPDAAPSETPSHRRLDVQGLRAVAVTLVVAFHAGLPVSGGFIGVDVFLVISGFVITGMLLRGLEKSGTIRLRTFYARRIKRILPALALVTTLVMGASVFLGSSFGSQQTTAATGLGATYVSANIVIYRESIQYFSPAAETNPLLHTWTLSVEEQVYLIFPSLLLGSWIVGRLVRGRSFGGRRREGDRMLVGRRSLRGSRRAATYMLIAVGVASFLVSLFVSFGKTSISPEWAFYSSIARVWEFAVGAGLALAASRLKNIRPVAAAVLGIAGACAIVVGAFTISGGMPYPGLAVLVPVLGAAAVIAAGSRATSPASRILSLKPMVKIGDVSYSWYLWHWPLIVFAAIIWPGTTWILVAVGLGSIIPAWLSYIGMERPIRSSKKIRGWRVVALALVCTLVPTAAALGLAAGARDSWGNEEVADMQAQVGAVHAPTELKCDQGAVGAADAGPACEFNVASTNAHVYLVGNSIAAMYSEALIGASEKLDLPLTLDTHSGGFCDALNGRGCTEALASAWDKLMKRPPGVVVMSGTWDLGAFSGSASDLTAKEEADLLTEDLGKIIRRLNKVGHHVLIVMPTPRFFYGPEPGTFDPYPVRSSGDREVHSTVWRPRDCSAAVAQTDISACGAEIPKSDVKASQELSFETLTALAKDTGSTTLDLRDRYCVDGVCRTNDGDFWMFEDGLHITVAESRELAPTFTRVLRDVIREQWGPRSEREEREAEAKSGSQSSDEGGKKPEESGGQPADDATPEENP